MSVAAAPSINLAIVGPLETCDEPQRGGLARAARTEQHDELALLHVDRHIIDRDDIAESLRHPMQANFRHKRLRCRFH
jgi:hypothetical protein